ncbi:hypothetical protein B0H14DRAFT_3896675 [Mycena olivaceomarginata]|nr:hypothetical protein B0H14DRAFT_3896675 [Mycena olivaceomarginata]
MGTPALKIPYELTAKIFSYCLPVHRRVRPNQTKAPLQVAQICGHWRSLGKHPLGCDESGDGTSHKNETYESRHATVINDKNKPVQFFLGIKTAVNHTSQTQLDGWIELIEELWDLLRESGLCSEEEAVYFWNLVTGFQSDHAEDQKKLFQLLKEYKRRLEREQWGANCLRDMPSPQVLTLIFRATFSAVEKAGGYPAWDALGEEEQQRRCKATLRDIQRELGQEAFDKLSPEEQADIDFFVWAGCCMHKDINAFKGGVKAVEAWWDENGVDGPQQMPNRDNAATLRVAAGTTAAARAKDVTRGGVAKLLALAGAIFRHKDRKRGQQDTPRFFFEHKLGFSICFPDTSNTRFQSTMNAACVVVTYHDTPVLHIAGGTVSHVP